MKPEIELIQTKMYLNKCFGFQNIVLSSVSGVWRRIILKEVWKTRWRACTIQLYDFAQLIDFSLSLLKRIIFGIIVDTRCQWVGYFLTIDIMQDIHTKGYMQKWQNLIVSVFPYFCCLTEVVARQKVENHIVHFGKIPSDQMLPTDASISYKLHRTKFKYWNST